MRAAVLCTLNVRFAVSSPALVVAEPVAIRVVREELALHVRGSYRGPVGVGAWEVVVGPRVVKSRP